MEHAFVTMGHSVGEYASVAASGALSLADTAKLLSARATAMEALIDLTSF